MDCKPERNFYPYRDVLTMAKYHNTAPAYFEVIYGTTTNLHLIYLQENRSVTVKVTLPLWRAITFCALTVLFIAAVEYTYLQPKVE